MRHGNKINNLGRTSEHRNALLSNLASQLITHKRIVTTLAKAKALRVYVEPLITKTKRVDSKEIIMNQHRQVFSYLNNKSAVKELFMVIGPKVADRPGGYTRIIKLPTRLGDNAEMALIELVDFNELYLPKQVKADTTKKTRRGRSKKESNNLTPDAQANLSSNEGTPITDTADFDLIESEVEGFTSSNPDIESNSDTSLTQGTVDSGLSDNVDSSNLS